MSAAVGVVEDRWGQELTVSLVGPDGANWAVGLEVRGPRGGYCAGLALEESAARELVNALELALRALALERAS